MSEVDRYLASRGVAESERREVLDTLVRTALVDDGRYAETRARTLADRGAGNELIRHDLARAGVDPERVSAAIATLGSEGERAARIVAQRGASARTARYLARKGFSEDAVHGVVAQARDETLG